MTRVNINILGISELKWTEMGEFNSDDHCLYYYRQENDRMISVFFQGKPFNITVIQVYVPTKMLKKLKLNGSTKTCKTFYN